MSASTSTPDILTLTGIGGFFNGEVFLLHAGESATLGSSRKATFPVTLCRNFRRLDGDPSRPMLLTRLAAVHIQITYRGRGKVLVDNLAKKDVHVGWRPLEGRTAIDLLRGRVEIGFGYGERLVASSPGSPSEYQEFASHPDEQAEIEGVFVALLSPGGGNSAGRRKHSYLAHLLPEPEDGWEDTDPERDTGPIPLVPSSSDDGPPPRSGRGFFRSLLSRHQ